MQTKSMADRALFFAVLIFIIVTGLLMSKNLSSLAIVFKIIQLISAAAIIGGVADWYGVVSIYGKPLGINWKTEIVISKKKELVTGISDFICDDILSKSNIVSKFENMNFANRIANIFSIRDVNNEDIFNYFSDFIVEVLWVSSDKIDRSEFLKNIDALLSILTKSTSPTLETTKFVKFLIDDDHHIELIDAMIPEIRKMIQRDNFKGFINSIVSNAADAYCEDNSLRTTFSSRIEESLLKSSSFIIFNMSSFIISSFISVCFTSASESWVILISCFYKNGVSTFAANHPLNLCQPVRHSLQFFSLSKKLSFFSPSKSCTSCWVVQESTITAFSS